MNVSFFSFDTFNFCTIFCLLSHFSTFFSVEVKQCQTRAIKAKLSAPVKLLYLSPVQVVNSNFPLFTSRVAAWSSEGWGCSRWDFLLLVVSLSQLISSKNLRDPTYACLSGLNLRTLPTYLFPVMFWFFFTLPSYVAQGPRIFWLLLVVCKTWFYLFFKKKLGITFQTLNKEKWTLFIASRNIRFRFENV